MYNIGSLLTDGFVAAGTFLKILAILGRRTGQAMSSVYPSDLKKVVGCYYRSPLYLDIAEQKQLKNVFGEDVMAVTVEQFLK